MAMFFWGVEIKAGEPVKVVPGEGFILHLSQATLAESKKGNESGNLYVHIEEKRLVLATLSAEKNPNQSFDLVFEKEFELSHNLKSGSVHFLGYRAEVSADDDSDSEDMFDSEDDEEEEEDVPLVVENGKGEAKADKSKASVDKAKVAKPATAAAKVKAKDVKPVSDDDDSSGEDDSDEDESDDEDMIEAADDEEESSDEEDEATPKKAKKGKRPAESVPKTPVPTKKAKLVTPQKSGGDGKKGNTHTATPHPAKGGKTADKSKPQTPKSGGQIACKSCSKTFNSDGALQSHTKAKHSDAK